MHKLLDSVEVECLDNQQIEGDFTTVILCMYVSELKLGYKTSPVSKQ